MGMALLSSVMRISTGLVISLIVILEFMALAAMTPFEAVVIVPTISGIAVVDIIVLFPFTSLTETTS